MDGGINILNINALPKVDLHRHISGSLTAETVLSIANHDGIKLSDDEIATLQMLNTVGGNARTLAGYLKSFGLIKRCMQTPYALWQAAYASAVSAAAENVIYAELRFAPFTHLENGMSPEEAVESVLSGVKQAADETGIQTGIILMCMRELPEDINFKILELTKRSLNNGVVAIDLAGDESNPSYKASRYSRIFKTALDYGLSVTIHAGEAAGADSIKEALDAGAMRLGHGVRLNEDPALMELVFKRQIPLEMCPTSNIHTGAAKNWESYPLTDYLRRGLLVTVNTDNPALSDTSVTEELMRCQKHCGLTDDEVLQTVKNSISAAFTRAEIKENLYKQLKTIQAPNQK